MILRQDRLLQCFCLTGGAELRRLIEDDEPCGLTGVVVAKVLQELATDTRSIEGHLAQWDIIEPRGFETYSEAAIFRAAGAKGITLATTDTLMAALALEHGTVLFTLDRDFSRIVRCTRLMLYSF